MAKKLYIQSGNASNRRPYVNSPLRIYVEVRDKGICVYCGEFGSILDHVMPLSKGGPNSKSNLVLACERCNQAKSDKMEDKWLVIAFTHLLRKGESLDWLD